MSEIDKNSQFVELVRKIIIDEKRGFLPGIAENIGLNDTKLRSRLHGRALFSLTEIGVLIKVLNDKRLADCILAGTGFQAVHCEAKPGGELRGETELAVIETGHLMEVVRDALKDGKVSPNERFNILRELKHLEDALASIRALLDKPS